MVVDSLLTIFSFNSKVTFWTCFRNLWFFFCTFMFRLTRSDIIQYLFKTFILSTSLRSISLKKNSTRRLWLFDFFLTFLRLFFLLFWDLFFSATVLLFTVTFWLFDFSLWLFLCDVFVTFFSKVFDIFLCDLPLSDDGITKILNLYTVGCWIGVILKQNIFRFLLFLTEFLQVKKNWNEISFRSW